MNKRERLEKTFIGELTDRIPVALWRHFPGDDQRAADLAWSIVQFQEAYDWDFVNIIPPVNFLVYDYGIQDNWLGNPNGQREIIKHLIQRSIDWTDLRALEPARGNLGKQLEAIRFVTEHLADDDTPILQTVYSPLTQAAQLAGRKLLIQHMRTEPDRLRSGLSTLTQSTLRFIDSLRRSQIDGIVYVTELATYGVMSAVEYSEFGIPYDRKIMEALAEHWWFNTVQIYGSRPIFELFVDLPIQAINWQDSNGHPNLADAKLLFRGAVCGGLNHLDHLQFGTPSTIRQVARDAIYETASRRFILASSGPFPITSPFSNIRAAREVVESVVAT